MRCKQRRGFTLLETMIVMVIIGIIAAAVLPNIGKSLVDARESTALQHIRTIHAAQASYFSHHGEFAGSMAQLGPPPGAGLIPQDLSRGSKMGYKFAIAPAPEGYAITAQPQPPQGTARSFYSDGSLVVHHQAAGAGMATAESPELGSTK